VHALQVLHFGKVYCRKCSASKKQALEAGAGARAMLCYATIDTYLSYFYKPHPNLNALILGIRTLGLACILQILIDVFINYNIERAL
jgi:hypothetical protein